MFMIKPNMRPMQRSVERGSSLIEVLVAILILSIGMLGIAGLQMASMKFSQGGWARAAVASQLSDLADRVRSNPDSSTTAYLLTSTYAAQRDELGANEVVADKDCDTETCNPAQLAAFQLVGWRLALNRSMPGSAAMISGTRDTGYMATVAWFDKTYFDEGDPTKLATPAACPDTQAEGMADRSCCPAALQAANGVRCTNMAVIP